MSLGSPQQMHHEAVTAPVLNVAYYCHGEEVVHYYNCAAHSLKKEQKIRLPLHCYQMPSSHQHHK
eukprot:14142169-Ditylum_brightwellii.AAC.1